MPSRFSCPKCNHDVFATSEFRATGGFLTKVFNVQTKRFTTVTCERCKYTELYQADSSTLGDIFDFLAN